MGSALLVKFAGGNALHAGASGAIWAMLNTKTGRKIRIIPKSGKI